MRNRTPMILAIAACLLTVCLAGEAAACDALGQQQCVQQFQGDYGVQQLQSGYQLQRFAQPVYVQRVLVPQRQRGHVQQFRQQQRFKVQRNLQRQRVLQNTLPPAEETIELRNGFLGLGSRTIIRRRF